MNLARQGILDVRLIDTLTFAGQRKQKLRPSRPTPLRDGLTALVTPESRVSGGRAQNKITNHTANDSELAITPLFPLV